VEGERFNVDVTPLLNIDVSKLNIKVDVNIDPQAGSAIAGAVLSLDELNNIDWDLVASSVLGITDPIGQLKEWLASVLSSFVDAIKKLIEDAMSGIRSLISEVWSSLRYISDRLSALVDMVRSVVVRPILDALDWVSRTLPRLVDLASEALRSYARAIDDLPRIVGRFTDTVATVFSDLLARVRDGFARLIDQLVRLSDLVRSLYAEVTTTFYRLADVIATGLARLVEQISRFPDLIRDLAGRVADTFSELATRIREGLAWFIEQVAKLPGMVRELVSTVAGVFSELLARVREGLAELVKRILEIPGVIRDLVSAVASLFADLAGRVRDSIQLVLEAVGRLQELVRDLASSVLAVFAELTTRVREGLAQLLDQMARFPDLIRELAGRVADIFSELASRVRAGFEWFIEQIGKVPDMVRDLAARIADVFGDLASRIREGLVLLADQLAKLPGLVGELATTVTNAFSELLGRIREGLAWFIEQIGKLPGLVESLASAVVAVFAELTSRIREGLAWFIEQVARFPDLVRDLVGRVADAFAELLGRVRDGLAWVAERILEIPSLVRDLISTVVNLFAELASRVREGFSWFIEQVSRLPALVSELAGGVASALADLASRVRDSIQLVLDTVARLQELMRVLASDVVAMFNELATRIREGFSWFIDTVARLPEVARSVLDAVTTSIIDMLERARAGFAWFLERVAELPRIARDLADVLIAVFSGAIEQVKAGLEWLLNTVARLPDLMRELELRVVEVFADLAGRLREGLEWLVNTLERVPEVIRSVVKTLIGDVEAGVGGVVEWVRRGFEQVDKTLSTALTGIREWLEAATATIREAGVAFMGFVNAVLQLPEKLAEKLKEAFKSLVDLAEAVVKAGAELAKEPFELLKRFVLEPLSRGFRWLWERLVEEWKILYGALSSALTWLWEKLVETAIAVGGVAVKATSKAVEWMLAAVASIVDALVALATRFVDFLFGGGRRTARDVETVFIEALKRDVGVAENLWALSSDLVLPFWKATLGPLMLRGFVKTFGDVEVIVEPEILGGKLGGARYSVKLSELADAYTRAFEIFYTGYSFGVAMALANTLLVNIQHLYVPRVVSYYQPKVKDVLGDILAEEIKEGARVDMFVKPVTETALIDYARRSLALSEGLKDVKTLKSLLATIRAYLKIYGLPEWYVEFLTKHPEELMIDFEDRFGIKRKVFLSHIFELPTHSEMARMTQRDIFPSLREMWRVGWVRGWNPDLTTMIYLLTFKYPSFEKLWQFYMRALAGMLWFKAPETIKMVFDKEAQDVQAGPPVSPLDLQKRLAGPDQVKAFETALNAYFKWLEYSNFSWFTPHTRIQEVPVGAEIYSKLGGWTADSWLMVDVAADIPTKIDMRWMSRYGIFLLMAERFEAAGVKFESYAPMVEVVPRLLDASPATPVQVDLTWFSKLLQATGLHPAWVPVTTVAENIMVIADEMTLLRTGWLNLFKEGMLTVDDVERFLAGLLVASYKVGYWDPEKKVWTSGWINLPVRWLPHERRLLQLRMAMDRVLDIYREIYGYIRSGIRTLAVTPEEARAKLERLVTTLDAHYRELTKAITGVEMTLKLDTKYAEMWLELQRLAQDIEAYERVRTWWSRVSGWLLYRVAYGWVTDEELSRLIDVVSKFIPLHPVEVRAYKEIAGAVLSIARKESIPSPSTLATFAEYMVISVETVKEVLSAYNVPERYHELWIRYIAVKPVKSDYKAVITAALKAFRYGAIAEEEWRRILEEALRFGFTEQEVVLIGRRAFYEILVDEAREWRPTLLTLISIIEYVPEAVELLKHYRVDPVFRPVVEKYAFVKPLADEVRVLVNALYRAKRYVEIPRELEEKVLSIARQLGVTDVELAMRDLALELQVLVDESRVWLPTPTTIATLAEYVTLPRELVEEALKARRVPSEWAGIWLQYIAVRPVKSDYRAVLMTALRALRYGAITEDVWRGLLEASVRYGFTRPEVELLQLRAELELMVEEARLWRPSLLTLIGMIEYVPEAVGLLEHYRVDPVFKPVIEKYALAKPLADEVRVLVNSLYRAKRYVDIPRELEERVLSIARQLGVTDFELALRDLALELQVLVDEHRAWIPTPTTIATLMEYVSVPRELVEKALKARRVPEEWLGIWLQYITVRPVKADYRAVLMVALRALRYKVIADDTWRGLLEAAAAYGFTKPEVELLQLRAELELLIEEARLWRPSLTTLIAMLEYVPEAVKLLEYYRVDPAFKPYVERYAMIKPLADEVRVLVNALYRAKRYIALPVEIEERVLSIARQLGVTDAELTLRDLALELQVLVDEARAWLPSPTTLATLAEYVSIPRELVEGALRARRVPVEWANIWLQYIAVRPLKADYRAVLSVALRALRYKAITEDAWKRLLEDAVKYGFTRPEVELLQLRSELELAIEEAREYVPTPAMMATFAEHLPEVRAYIKEVLEARRVRGVWVELWTKYIYLRPVVDEVRRWANAMFRLAEYMIIDVKQLEPVLKILETYGWEKLEAEIMVRTVLAEQARRAFTEVLGPPRTLTAMARYTDKAADFAYTRVARLIDALPVDQATKNLLKQMWKEYITTYQSWPEISGYITELITAYGEGVIDDVELGRELEYLRKLGVPEARLAFAKRRAMLRRVRVLARRR